MFQKAQRSAVKLKIGVQGPSGSGKTFSALRLAKGLGKKIALVDTENSSASLYADKFDFDTVTMHPPYTVEKYFKAIEEAEKAGYDVLILDTISHEWIGEGGLLDKKAVMDSRPGSNSYTNWNNLTPIHRKFLSRILNSKLHIISTMRSKQAYLLQQNEKGKQVPVKTGMEPEQRDGVEYEFTTVFNLEMDHVAKPSKDRTGLFNGFESMITEDTGALFVEWLNSGAPEKEQTPVETPAEPVQTPPALPPEFNPDDEFDQRPAPEMEKVNTAQQVAPPVQPEPQAVKPIGPTLVKTAVVMPGEKVDGTRQMKVGKYAGKTFEQILKEDSVQGFKYAQWNADLFRKGTTLHQDLSGYLRYAQQEGALG